MMDWFEPLDGVEYEMMKDEMDVKILASTVCKDSWQIGSNPTVWSALMYKSQGTYSLNGDMPLEKAGWSPTVGSCVF